jgi:hypothetical protein
MAIEIGLLEVSVALIKFCWLMSLIAFSCAPYSPTHSGLLPFPYC